MAATLFMSSGFLSAANGQDDKGTWAMKKSAWLLLTPAERGQVHDFAEDYKNYLTVTRTAAGVRKLRRWIQSSGKDSCVIN